MLTDKYGMGGRRIILSLKKFTLERIFYKISFGIYLISPCLTMDRTHLTKTVQKFAADRVGVKVKKK